MTNPVKHLRSLQSLLRSSHVKSTIHKIISLLAHAQQPESRQFGLMGQLLVLLDRISLHPPDADGLVDIIPLMFMIVKNADEASAPLYVDDNFVGFALIQKPRLQFWFKDGPGADAGDEQKSFVKGVLLECFQEINEVKSTTVDKHGDIQPGQVFLFCVDMRYVPIIKEISTPLWGEDSYGVYELPEDVLFTGAKKLGDVWTDLQTGEVFELDTVNAEDYDQIREYSTVNYDPNYLMQLLTKQPMVSLSRAIRIKTPTASSKKGTMVAWIVSHLNLSLGLLSTVSTHRRRGLANICVESIAEAQREWIKMVAGEQQGVTDALRPYCFIADYNVASFTLFKRAGFVRAPCPMRNWMGVKMLN